MKNPHWHYFVAISEDLEKTSRFVEPTPDNFKTYSVEYARLYLAIGSEVDVVAKLLCEKINATAKRGNIDDYRAVILAVFPDFSDIQVVIPRYEISLTPWKDWRSGLNPTWWRKHNDVKHERNKAFRDANMENTLNALGGLLVLVGYLYAEDLGNKGLAPSWNFVQFDTKYYGGVALGPSGNIAGFWLPGIAKPKSLLDAIAKSKRP